MKPAVLVLLLTAVASWDEPGKAWCGREHFAIGLPGTWNLPPGDTCDQVNKKGTWTKNTLPAYNVFPTWNDFFPASCRLRAFDTPTFLGKCFDNRRRQAASIPPASSFATRPDASGSPSAPSRAPRVVFLGDSVNGEHFEHLKDRLVRDAAAGLAAPAPAPGCPGCPRAFPATAVAFASAGSAADGAGGAVADAVELIKITNNVFRDIPEALELRAGDVVVASFAIHHASLAALMNNFERFLAAISQPRLANVTFLWKEAAPTHFPVPDGTWHTCVMTASC